jgi:hypothetical protein
MKAPGQRDHSAFTESPGHDGARMADDRRRRETGYVVILDHYAIGDLVGESAEP